MKMAFCLFRYFPYGGLQRDFLRIAREMLARGHIVDVYTMSWEAPLEPDLGIRILSVIGKQNHTRRQAFVRQLQKYIEVGAYDCIVGFNKMPGLDVYYAADTCYQAKARLKHSWLYRLTSRYRSSVEYEDAVFSKQVATQILLLAKQQQIEFQTYYHTPDERFHLLPPGITADRDISRHAAQMRKSLRHELGVYESEWMLLMVGSGFKTKGVDRTLQAFADLTPDVKKRTWVFIVGQDDPAVFLKQAKKLGIADRVVFLGGRDDVPRFLAAADILLHPAYNENTGTVILEALVAGLPVITTDVCGYAEYVTTANAGRVLSPYSQSEFTKILYEMLMSPERPQLRENALRFAKTADIYALPQRAADLIERFAGEQG